MFERVVTSQNPCDQFFCFLSTAATRQWPHAYLDVLLAAQSTGLNCALLEVDDPTMANLNTAPQAHGFLYKAGEGLVADLHFIFHLGDGRCGFGGEHLVFGVQRRSCPFCQIDNATAQRLALVIFRALALDQACKGRFGDFQIAVSLADFLVDQLDGKSIADAVFGPRMRSAYSVS